MTAALFARLASGHAGVTRKGSRAVQNFSERAARITRGAAHPLLLCGWFFFLQQELPLLCYPEEEPFVHIL